MVDHDVLQVEKMLQGGKKKQLNIPQRGLHPQNQTSQWFISFPIQSRVHQDTSRPTHQHHLLGTESRNSRKFGSINKKQTISNMGHHHSKEQVHKALDEFRRKTSLFSLFLVGDVLREMPKKLIKITSTTTMSAAIKVLNKNRILSCPVTSEEFGNGTHFSQNVHLPTNNNRSLCRYWNPGCDEYH